MVQVLDTSYFSSFNLSGTTTVLMYILGIVFFGALIFLLIRLKQYKYKVIILNEVGETFDITQDKGAIIRGKDGIVKFFLFKNRKTVLPEPNASYFYFWKKKKTILVRKKPIGVQ